MTAIGSSRTCEVVELLEFVEHSGKPLVLRAVPVGCIRLDLRGKSIQIQKQIDVRLLKGIHAALVVAICFHVVDANGIGSELFHQLGVELALVGVDKRVVGGSLVSDACSNEVSARCLPFTS